MNAETFKKLRIIFSIASAATLVPIIPVAAIFGLTPALIEAGVAALLFLGAVYFKNKQEETEHPAEDKPDFFNPKSDK